MCLAIPARVCEINEGDQAIVDLGGVRKECSLALVDGVAVGDYVILHVGYALTRLDPEEAAKTLALMAEAGVVAARDGGHIGNAGAVSDLAARDGGHIGNAGAVSDVAADA